VVIKYRKHNNGCLYVIFLIQLFCSPPVCEYIYFHSIWIIIWIIYYKYMNMFEYIYEFCPIIIISLIYTLTYALLTSSIVHHIVTSHALFYFVLKCCMFSSFALYRSFSISYSSLLFSSSPSPFLTGAPVQLLPGFCVCYVLKDFYFLRLIIYIFVWYIN